MTGPVALRDWAEGDLPVLEATMGDPLATRYLGGPEPPEKLAGRHARYLALAGSGRGRMFVILAGAEAAGSVGYWDAEEDGAPVYEMGWSIVPALQGRGLASGGTRLALDRARAERRHRWVYAHPSVENAASNALCRSVGFELLGEADVEYPPGTPMRVNRWRIALW
ncbi:GNAT family N-acetyltransferase [Georgenia sp. AZ-5]|uniref:GNAT family N-acetyltransferase n=1 Tax=Georgenia sp. AZ-5 TaxID=3367526 RepID=UPI003754F405